ncbi:MAG: 3-isopropylmalate dehydratase large subunit, partial [Planctomycetes bacterium]|nr:3-isopropylmalate dehydratase large subunit [Planctomycetota bacterium]
MSKNLFNKIWDLHTVKTLPTGQTQLFIGLHLIHEVTSPQAFAMLKERELNVLRPDRTFATVDHIVPTDSQARPYDDGLAEKMMQALEQNTREHGIEFFDLESGLQGIVHVIGPELGLTQPGMTIACGDSHTSTHGAFGAIGFGVGTTQIRDILATQTMALSRPKVRKIQFNGTLSDGVTAKDLILYLISQLGVNGGIGFAYEFAGPAIEALDMEARMSVCNMSIEGGARVGYISPDQTTYDYLKGRKYVPQGEAFDKAVAFWQSLASDVESTYDEVVTFDAGDIEPMVTWGVNPGQAVGVSQNLPQLADCSDDERQTAELAYEHMGFTPGQAMAGSKIDVAFIGSCTNGRISDLRAAAEVAKGRRVAPGVRAFVVPGSMQVA